MGKDKSMKAYVKYDGSGNVVPGSLITRTNKPEGRGWVEVPYDRCCSISPETTTTTTTTTAAPVAGPRVSGTVITGATTLTIETDSPNVTLTQNGTPTTYPNADPIVMTVVEGSEFVLQCETTTTTLKFVGAELLTANLESIDAMVSMYQMFDDQASMITFECDADLSTITDFGSAWNFCESLTSFPEIDTSSAINSPNMWGNCTSLICIAGTIDFTLNATNYNTYTGCVALVEPAAGSAVRDAGGSDGAQGVWTNAGACP